MEAAFTVKSLRKYVRKRRSKWHSSDPCCQCDHIVELQIIVAAINATSYKYAKASLRNLLDFFDEKDNVKKKDKDKNQKKGQAVTRFLKGNSQPEDMKIIKSISNHWKKNLEPKLENFKLFKIQLNKILDV